MATWKLAPDTGQISGGPHSSMPLVVIPSDIEIGAITLAEAQSSRYYNDSGLVTEVAREVVSSDELHFDGSSVSSSSEYWMDFDGVRSDYAVTATYGRNAVWSDYVGVWHLNEVSGGAIDSTGNNDLNDNNTVGSATGKIEGGRDYESANSEYHSITDASQTGLGFTGGFSFTTWMKRGSTGGFPGVFAKRTTNSTDFYNVYFESGNKLRVGWEISNAVTEFEVNTAITDTTNFIHLAGVGDVSAPSASVYRDGVSQSMTTRASAATSIGTNTDPFWLGGFVGTANTFDGIIDEMRIRTDLLTANWITTEYNNQNDNAAFWVATDVSGGGGGGWVGYPMIHMLQFNCVM